MRTHKFLPIFFAMYRCFKDWLSPWPTGEPKSKLISEDALLENNKHNTESWVNNILADAIYFSHHETNQHHTTSRVNAILRQTTLSWTIQDNNLHWLQASTRPPLHHSRLSSLFDFVPTTLSWTIQDNNLHWPQASTRPPVHHSRLSWLWDNTVL